MVRVSIWERCQAMTSSASSSLLLRAAACRRISSHFSGRVVANWPQISTMSCRDNRAPTCSTRVSGLPVSLAISRATIRLVVIT